MWPDIVKLELGDVEFYNYGESGSGNQYIRNLLFVANEKYKFNKDDLVMVCWSSAFRNDWFTLNGWVTEGNAFFPGDYGSKLDTALWDLNHYTIRDASVITGASKFLETLDSQTHQFAIINNFSNGDQEHGYIEQEILDHPECKPYVEYLKTQIKPSYWEMGYDLEYNNVILNDIPLSHRDDHPLPNTTLAYLTKTFDHKFSQDTIDKVNIHNNEVWNLFCEYAKQDPGNGFYKFIETNSNFSQFS